MGAAARGSRCNGLVAARTQGRVNAVVAENAEGAKKKAIGASRKQQEGRTSARHRSPLSPSFRFGQRSGVRRIPLTPPLVPDGAGPCRQQYARPDTASPKDSSTSRTPAPEERQDVASPVVVRAARAEKPCVALDRPPALRAASGSSIATSRMSAPLRNTSCRTVAPNSRVVEAIHGRTSLGRASHEVSQRDPRPTGRQHECVTAIPGTATGSIRRVPTRTCRSGSPVIDRQAAPPSPAPGRDQPAPRQTGSTWSGRSVRHGVVRVSWSIPAPAFQRPTFQRPTSSAPAELLDQRREAQGKARQRPRPRIDRLPRPGVRLHRADLAVDLAKRARPGQRDRGREPRRHAEALAQLVGREHRAGAPSGWSSGLVARRSSSRDRQDRVHSRARRETGR